MDQLDQTAYFYVPADPRLITFTEQANEIMLHHIKMLDNTQMDEEAAERLDTLRKEVEDVEIRDIGSYSIYAKPTLDGAYVDGEFVSEDEYLKLREEMASIVGVRKAVKMGSSNIRQTKQL